MPPVRVKVHVHVVTHQNETNETKPSEIWREIKGRLRREDSWEQKEVGRSGKRQEGVKKWQEEGRRGHSFLEWGTCLLLGGPEDRIALAEALTAVVVEVDAVARLVQRLCNLHILKHGLVPSRYNHDCA